MNAVLRAGGELAPINPQSFEDVQRIAKMAVQAGLSPRDRKDDDDTAIAKASMAIMQGLECGVPPMQAVQGIAIINGKALMYGDILTALLWSKGFKVKKWIEGDGENSVGHARITRPDGEVIEKKFSVADAKRARLWDAREKVSKQWDGKWTEKPNDSPWFKFWPRMLEWRALGFCVKDGASDATHGMLVLEEASPDYNRDVVDISPVVDALPMPPEISSVPDEAEPADDMLADAEGFLSKLAEDRGFCQSEGDVCELREGNEDLIKRLSATDQQRAEEILNGAAE